MPSDSFRASFARSARNASSALLCALIASGLVGCSGAVAGDWKMVKCVPNREVFAIEQAQFKRDGSYSARITIEGKQADTTGAYNFNGSKLTLRPSGGGQYSWNAFLRFNRLEITSGKRQVILERS